MAPDPRAPLATNRKTTVGSCPVRMLNKPQAAIISNVPASNPAQAMAESRFCLIGLDYEGNIIAPTVHAPLWSICSSIGGQMKYHLALVWSEHYLYSNTRL